MFKSLVGRGIKFPLRNWQTLRTFSTASTAENTTKHIKCNIGDCWLDDESRLLHVVYQEGDKIRRGRYPFIWLQDNCQSQESFNPVIHSRKTLLASLDPNLKPIQVKPIQDGEWLELLWENGRVSYFPGKFLLERLFPNDRRESGERTFSNYMDDLGTVKYWGSDMINNIQSFDYNEIINEDQTLARWIECLYRDGLVIVTNARDDETVPLRSFCKRVAYTRQVNFGDIFEVFTRSEPQNVAYTNSRLNFHTDMPAYKNAPEIQLLHCRRQAFSGGRNELVDGFKVAEHIRYNFPDTFETLVNTQFDFREYGHDDHVGWFDLHAQHNIIQLDPITKEVVKVVFSQHQRSSQLQVDLEMVEKVYSALLKWNSLMYDERFMFKYRLKENEILCFNNLRVLHGREEFKVNPDEDGERWLQGCYLEWDEVRSRYRCLRNVFGREWDDAV